MKQLSAPCLSRKNRFKFCKFISCIYSTMFSKFKNFFQIIRTCVIDKFGCNSVYKLTLLLVSNQFINLKSYPDYVMHLIYFQVKSNVLILHILYFLCHIFSKIRVPGWTCVIKIRLNKCTAEYFSKFLAYKSVSPIKEL